MRRRNKNVSTFWGGQNLSEKFCWRPLFQSLLMPQKTWARGQESPSWYCLNVNWKTPFHAEPRQSHEAPNAELHHAADASQPIRSVAIRKLLAAGSHR